MTLNERQKSETTRPKAAVILVVFLSATNSIFFKLSTVPAMVYVGGRFFVCTMVFLAVIIARRLRRKKVTRISRRQFICLFLTGFVFSTGAFAYFVALKETALSSALILNSSNSVFIVLLSVIFLKDRPKLLAVLAIFIAMGGCAIVFAGRTGGSNTLLGNICALICAMCAAIYMVVMKYFAEIEVPVKLCIVYGGSCFFAVAAVFVQGDSFLFMGDGQPIPYYEYLWMLCGGVIAVCIPQTVVNWALRYVKATFTGSITLLEPIIATVYGWFIWNDRLYAAQIIGGILAIGGLYLYNWAEKKGEDKKNEDHE